MMNYIARWEIAQCTNRIQDICAYYAQYTISTTHILNTNIKRTHNTQETDT